MFPFGNVRAIRPLLPAKDFTISKCFYSDIGFRINPFNEDIAEVRFGTFSFLLQNRYVKEWAENIIMQVVIDELEEWWIRFQLLELHNKYDVVSSRAPVLEPWGQVVAYVNDPCGVSWHFAEAPKTEPISDSVQKLDSRSPLLVGAGLNHCRNRTPSFSGQ